MTDTLFKETDQVEQIEQDEDNQKNYVEELVGEGKKYKSVEELAKAYINADRFIPQLQKENQDLRGELQTRTTLEQFMDKMNKRTTPPDNTNQNTNPDELDGTENKNKHEDLETLLEKKLVEREQRAAEVRNFETVKSVLSEKFGNNVTTKLQELKQTLGVDENYINNLAKTQPKVLLALIDKEVKSAPVKEVPNIFNTPSSPISSDRIPNTGNNTRGWNYYEKIRKVDVNRYYSPQVQNEMFKQIQTLGEDRFYSS